MYIWIEQMQPKQTNMIQKQTIKIQKQIRMINKQIIKIAFPRKILIIQPLIGAIE